MACAINSTTADQDCMFAYEPSNGNWGFQTDTAHRANPATGSVDSVALQVSMTGWGTCTLMGFVTTGPSAWNNANGSPAWSYQIPNCQADVMSDTNYNADLSDDASTVAMSAFVNTTTGVFAKLAVLDAQTGKVIFTHETPATYLWGVSMSDTGAFVAMSVNNQAQIYDVDKQILRASVSLDTAWVAPAAISAGGDYVAVAGADRSFVYQWNGNQYALSQTLVPTGGQWYASAVDLQSFIPENEAGEIVSILWRDGPALTVRVTSFSLSTGKVLVDWTSSSNTRLQNTGAISGAGPYVAVGLWGDAGATTSPTIVLLKSVAGQTATQPLFSYVTPGSMFGIDVSYNTVGSTDNVWVVSGGKHVHANIMGAGGDAFAFQITTSH